MSNPSSTSNTTNQTVLVVDDEQGLADLYANWLEGCYTVHTSYNGTDALETLNQDIDVVLLRWDSMITLRSPSPRTSFEML